MAESFHQELVAAVVRWQLARDQHFNDPRMKYNSGSNAASLNKFVEKMNAMTSQFISVMGRQDEGFYAALVEMAQNASRLIHADRKPGEGKLFLDGSDQTRTGI